MNDTWNFLDKVPPMLTGEELKENMCILPEYNKSIRLEGQAVRLMELNEIYNLYLPSDMSVEIYSKIYLAMLRSLQKKGSRLAVRQRNENHKCIKQKDYSGIIGGSDSFSITGASGIGKSSAISRAIHLAGECVIEVQEPYCKVIPAFTVQCPFDCSVKGLLLQILRQVDEMIDTHYYKMGAKKGVTTDLLIGMVSQVVLNHVGLLVVDEIQNVVNHRQGKSLVGMLTQLINNSGISICMVGTPEVEEFFSSVNYLARRTLGLKYGYCDYNDYFRKFCEVLFTYQYTKNKTVLTDSMMYWLYEHSGGVLAVVVSLFHDAQEIAILKGSETLDINSLREAYDQRLGMLHDYIQPSTLIKNKTPKKKPKNRKTEELSAYQKTDTVIEHPENKSQSMEWSFQKLAEQAKKEHLDMRKLLEGKITVTEIVV